MYSYCYCEENAAKIAIQAAKVPDTPEDDVYLVFISNGARSVAMWHQGAEKLSFRDAIRLDSDAVVWDFHVIVLLRHPRGCSVYDLDSRLSSSEWPIAAHRYFGITFRSWMRGKIKSTLQP